MVALVVNVDGTMGTKKMKARMITIPTITTFALRLMPQRVASRDVYAYFRERPSDFGGNSRHSYVCALTQRVNGQLPLVKFQYMPA